MRWQYTPYILPIFIAAAVTVSLTLFAWQRRTAPGARAFTLLNLLLAEWLLGYALEVGSPDLAGKIFWGKVQYLAITTVPLLWLIFALQFTKQEKWLTRRKLGWVTIIPLTTILLNWTNEAHGLVWQQTGLDNSGPFPALSVSYGAWFWVHLTFSYLFMLLGATAFLRVLIYFPHLYRQQTGLILAGVLAPWVSNSIYIFKLSPVPNLDLTPFAFTLSGIAFGWSLFQFRLLDIVPVARRAVVEGMSDAVIVIDPQDRIVDLNPAARQFFNHHTPKTVGRTITQELSSWSDFMARYRDVIEGQAEIASGTGQAQRYFDMRISPLYGRRKQYTGRLIVLRDITERKQAEETLALARDQALAASRLKTELLAKVSHELRTPLSVILGFTEMLQLGIYGSLNEEQQKVAAEIIGSTHDLTTLVSELLAQAQLDAGQLKLNLGPVALSDLVEGALSRMRILAQTKGLALTATIAPDIPEALTGDQVRLQQILINLVSNAIKFTQAGAVIVHFYCPDPAHWAVRVSDTGPGIPIEAQSYIFEPFRQVDGSLTRQQGGTGLGLSIVKQLTTLMGGEITLESTVGQGSTFTIVLPLEG